MYTAVSIAGTDPSGGAGMQADLKTFMAHKVYGMGIITALVAQNTCGVKDIMNVQADFLRQQFACVFEDIYPDAVKIGMVSQPALIKEIVYNLKKYEAKKIVLDPVMFATSKDRLLEEEAFTLLKNELIPLADIITPNIPEAEILSGTIITHKAQMVQAAQQIAKNYKGYILIKGGHLQDSADDLLYVEHQAIWLPCEKIATSNTHGTGCTLSSAIASNLAMGFDVVHSVRNAKAYITRALQANLNLGKGNGPLNHCCDM